MNVATDPIAEPAADPAACVAATDGHPSGPTVPAPHVDFHRPLVSILGLPFDAIDVTQAVQRIRADAFARRRCFVSTPNLNFAIAARRDAVFRDSVLHSDLSLVDGMPLVWIAKLLGLPVPERVAGSDLFEALQAHAGPAVSVFLFGAPPGVAALASERINQRGGGVRCVGFDAPGFGSIESMSTADQIDRINASGAQFVVVALGAKKGQEWIEHNATRLTAPVLSHLGAVVNFVAGTVLRAPRWMRWTGIEWLWRIKEEPGLWRRYSADGTAVLALFMGRVLPDAIRSRTRSPDGLATRRVAMQRSSRAVTLALGGDWLDDGAGELRTALAECAESDDRLTLDLSGVGPVGDRFVAILLLARGWFGMRGGFNVVGASAAVAATFRRKCAESALLGTE